MSWTCWAGLAACPPSCQWPTGHLYPSERHAPVELVSPSQFPAWHTGRQYPCFKRAIRVSTGSVPQAAHRPSFLHAGAAICPSSWALFSASVQSCSSGVRVVLAWLTRISESLPAIPDKLDVTPLAVAGSLPAADQLVHGNPPRLMLPMPALAWPRMKQRSAHETPR